MTLKAGTIQVNSVKEMTLKDDMFSTDMCVVNGREMLIT